MPRPGFPCDKWACRPDDYDKHVKVILLGVKSWDEGDGHRFALRPRVEAQYSPRVLPNRTAVWALERACIEGGHPITDLSDPKRRQHKFFMHCGEYFGDQRVVVGVCEAGGKPEETPYILVRWKDDGGFHGQPASRAYLRTNGVNL